MLSGGKWVSPGTEAVEVQKVSSDWKPFYVTSAQKYLQRGSQSNMKENAHESQC